MIENQCRCSYKGGYLVIRTEEDTKSIHLSEISSIVLHTNQVYISAYLLSELAKSKISLVVSDEKHNPVGQYLPLYGSHNVSKRVQEQLAWSEPSKKRVWQRVVQDKIRMQAAVLEWEDSLNTAKDLRDAIQEVRSGDTTNREGYAARKYFAELFGSDFTREQDNDLNASLNYGYAIVLSMVNREIVSRGYLTQSGICHRNEYNQFNLACDLMEPFRPVVDRTVIEYFAGDFDKEMRRALVDLANRSLSYRGGVYKLDSVVSLYVQDCFNALNKKIMSDEIEGFSFL